MRNLKHDPKIVPEIARFFLVHMNRAEEGLCRAEAGLHYLWDVELDDEGIPVNMSQSNGQFFAKFIFDGAYRMPVFLGWNGTKKVWVVDQSDAGEYKDFKIAWRAYVQILVRRLTEERLDRNEITYLTNHLRNLFQIDGEVVEEQPVPAAKAPPRPQAFGAFS
jgi:3-oxoacyl-[acyl-carrier-protein] synthase III